MGTKTGMQRLQKIVRWITTAILWLSLCCLVLGIYGVVEAFRWTSEMMTPVPDVSVSLWFVGIGIVVPILCYIVLGFTKDEVNG